MPEISDADYAQQQALLKLFDQVWNDPNVGQNVRRRAKELRPEINIPDDHPVAKEARTKIEGLETQVNSLQTMLTEYKSAGQQEKAEAALRKQLGDVQAKFKFTDDGMAKVIETMQSRQLADPEAAALIYRESIPKAPPQSPTARMFDTKADMWGTTKRDEQWEKLHVDPDGFFADVVAEVFSEMPA
jgi:uncharacterized protein (UPF0147 family)